MRMSICLTWFPIGGLVEPKIYHDSGVFYKNVGFYLEVFLEGIKWSHYETFFSHNLSRVVQYNFTRDIVTI